MYSDRIRVFRSDPDVQTGARFSDQSYVFRPVSGVETEHRYIDLINRIQVFRPDPDGQTVSRYLVLIQMFGPKLDVYSSPIFFYQTGSDYSDRIRIRRSSECGSGGLLHYDDLQFNFRT